MASHNKYPIALLVLFFLSLNFLDGINGFGKQQTISKTKLVVIHHETCPVETCPGDGLPGKTYSELKYDPQASLPSSFTICVSVLIKTTESSPSLFTLLGNDGQPWFGAKIDQNENFVGKHFHYPVSNQKPEIDTMRMFSNQWVRSCLALNTVTGSVQWVARGELVDNSTLPEITNNVPTDLSGKVILGSYFISVKWRSSRSKLTKFEVFSSALSVEKMMKFTKGEGCGDDGDYLSWDKMQWNFYVDAKIEHMLAEETCTMPSLNFYQSGGGGFEWIYCMHFCQNLGGNRVPSVSSSLQWERVRSFISEKGINDFWLAFYDEQEEGEWRDFYDHQVLNFTTAWAKNEPNGGRAENCVVVQSGGWYDNNNKRKHQCLCERQPSFHMRLRGLCTDSAVDKYYQPMNDLSAIDFLKDVMFVGLKRSTIKYDEKNKNWNMSTA